MRRSYSLIIVAAGVALLAIVFSALPQNSDPAMAASDGVQDPFEELLNGSFATLYQGQAINCTVSYTTTDSLNNINKCGVGQSVAYCAENAATTLSSYDNLALIDETDVPAGQERERAVHDDWFRLDNAEVGARYTVEATPNRTRNYNLGIIVYSLNYSQVTSDVDALDNDAEVSFVATNAGPYYFRVFQITDDCTGRTYDLNASKVAPTATPTSTPPPSSDEDPYEPNDSFSAAQAEDPTLPIQVPILLELTFHTVDDIDYFRFYTKDDRWYQATTSDLNLIDTVVEIYDRDRTRIQRDDDGAGGLASKASWQAKYNGYYYIVVQNNVDSVGTYNLTLDEISEPGPATPGASPTPGATPRASADDCEPNADFGDACVIAVNESATFNFVPGFGAGPDNDFYKVWVKPGLHFRCETSNLSPGVDPNMIVFTGPSWDQAIGGNDDIAPCDYNSVFNYYATYSGWLYVLIGTGNRTPPDIFDSSYTLLCEKSTTPFATGTPQPTATPDSSGKLPTAEPTATPTTTESPIDTPTPESQALSVRPLTTPTPPATAAPRFMPISLLVYYDANGDGQPGAGEGIAGISVQAYEVATNELLAQDFTDEQGNLEFTVSAQGPVRVSIPFLGVSHLIAGAEASIQVRVPPRSAPGGTP